jgi:hypothetical protein
MKTYPVQKFGLVASLALAAGLVSALAVDPSPSASAPPSASASPSASVIPTPPPTQTCNYASKNPESYAFYGAKDNVGDKVSKLPLKLSEHRVFLQITQGDAWGRVKLFELQKDGSFTVTEWEAKETSQLACAIDRAIMANKGVNCVGEQVKAAIVKALKHGHTTQSVAPPETPAAAFLHSINEAKGDFIKSEVVVLC